MVFSRKTVDLIEILRKAQCDTKKWLDAMETSSNGSVGALNNQRGSKQDRHRKKTEGELVKCNYDVSHHEGNQDSGLGWIIRNSNGQLLTCGMDKFQERYTIEEAELLALIWAIQAV